MLQFFKLHQPNVFAPATCGAIIIRNYQGLRGSVFAVEIFYAIVEFLYKFKAISEQTANCRDVQEIQRSKKIQFALSLVSSFGHRTAGGTALVCFPINSF